MFHADGAILTRKRKAGARHSFQDSLIFARLNNDVHNINNNSRNGDPSTATRRYPVKYSELERPIKPLAQSMKDFDGKLRDSGSQEVDTISQFIKSVTSSLFKSSIGFLKHVVQHTGAPGPGDELEDETGVHSEDKTVLKKPKKEEINTNKEKLLKTEFNPDLDRHNYENFNFVQSPIDWDLSKVTKPEQPDSTSTDYGKTFFKKKFSKLKKKSNPESEYLLSVYKGEFQSTPSKLIASDGNKSKATNDFNEKRINDIHKLTSELKTAWPAAAGTSTPSKGTTGSADVIIVKEVRAPPTPSLYSLSFDFSQSIFEEESRYYKKILAERRSKQTQVHRDKLAAETKPSLVRDLSQEEEAEIINIWKSRGKDNKTLVTLFDIPVKVTDLKTLADKQWLNDVVIEVYLKTLNTDKVFTFNSYFFTTLESRGYQGVQKWMKRAKVSIKDLEQIIVPINVHQTHWVTGIINMKDKKIWYLDSLAKRETPHGERALSLLKDYVVGETKRQGVAELSEGFVTKHITSCPQQQNGFDCGVFTLMNSLCSAQNRAFDYQPSEARMFRRAIAHTILHHG